MSDFKNRIITISGEPASGKSTVINKLRENYEKQGYNVHIFSVGHEFRRIAQEKGLTIEQFNEYMVKRGDIDKLIDSTVEQRGKEINSKLRENDIYIFDSRLAFHNIPDSFSIRLTVDDNVAGKRVFGDNKRGKEDKYNNLKEAIEKTHNRKITEIERYKKRYGIDLQDPDNYKLLIDTSFSSIEDIAKVIEECLELELEGKNYSKMWTSPKKLLPTQSEMSTLGRGISVESIDEMIKIIREEGFNPNIPILVLDVDGKKYIYDGHHANFAAGNLGKTLIPYKTIAKDDEYIKNSTRTARDYAKPIDLKEHEWLIFKSNESYNDIYPGIYEELGKKEPEER